MRTYSHAALTWTTARLAAPSEARVAVWATAGATLPDLPAAAGAAWLGLRRRRLDRTGFLEEVSAQHSFAGPDTALHSALSVGALLLVLGMRGLRGRSLRHPLVAFLIRWAGHVLADVLTHAEDARPILWPVSGRRFRSPVSYWNRSHHARTFAMVEHGALLILAARAISRRLRPPRPSEPPSG